MKIHKVTNIEQFVAKIIPKQAQKNKSIVESIQKKGRDEAQSNRKVYRPWGWYDSIESGENFQVKKLLL